MNYKDKTIQVLNEVAEKCDKEASAMIKDAENREWDGATDAIVFSSLLMNLHIQAKMLIMKIR